MCQELTGETPSLRTGWYYPECVNGKALGFDEGWLEGMLKVQSPSGPGHLYIYFPWDKTLDALPGKAKVDVLNAEGRLIAGMKLNNASVAAPGSLRFNAEGKKREGAYLPLSGQGPEPCRHAVEVDTTCWPEPTTS